MKKRRIRLSNLDRLIGGAFYYGLTTKQIARLLKMKVLEVESAIRRWSLA
jgi:hypothetical protein